MKDVSKLRRTILFRIAGIMVMISSVSSVSKGIICMVGFVLESIRSIIVSRWNLMEKVFVCCVKKGIDLISNWGDVWLMMMLKIVWCMMMF